MLVTRQINYNWNWIKFCVSKISAAFRMQRFVVERRFCMTFVPCPVYKKLYTVILVDLSLLDDKAKVEKLILSEMHTF